LAQREEVTRYDAEIGRQRLVVTWGWLDPKNAACFAAATKSGINTESQREDFSRLAATKLSIRLGAEKLIIFQRPFSPPKRKLDGRLRPD
jgi:hypothetical protein